MQCPLCNIKVLSKLYYNNYLKCPECGLFIRFVIPSATELKNSTSGQLLSACTDKKVFKIRHENAQKQYKNLKHYIGHGPIYDHGCNGGFFLKVCKEHGHEVNGNEISMAAILWAKKNFDLNIQYGFMEDIMLKSNHYEAVSFYNSIEHVLNLQQTLFTANRILKIDGVIDLYVPAKEDIENSIEPAHIYEFNTKCLKSYFLRKGYRVMQYEVGIFDGFQMVKAIFKKMY